MKVLATLAVALALLAGAAAAIEDDTTGGEAPRILVMIRIAPTHFRADADYGGDYAARPARAARWRAAEQIARTHGLQLRSHWPLPSIGVECFEMQLAPGAQVAEVIAAVARDARAAWVQPVQVFRALAYGDPLYEMQPTAAAWRLHDLHRSATGRGVLIAQIDSGVQTDHPDLRGQLHSVRNAVAGSRYRAEHHGTAVAGIIAARADNGIGMVGVAPGARLFAVRSCWERGQATLCDTLSLAQALQLAIDRSARVVNLSVSGPPDRLLGELLDATLAADAVVIAAADPDAMDGGFPAAHPGVISIADVDAARSSPAALAAPGSNVPTTLPDARWGLVSGASFAAAEVSGVAALLIELLPAANAAQVEALLREPRQRRARHEPAAPIAVDACRSVSAAAGRCVCDCAGDAAEPAWALR